MVGNVGGCWAIAATAGETAEAINASVRERQPKARGTPRPDAQSMYESSTQPYRLGPRRRRVRVSRPAAPSRLSEAGSGVPAIVSNAACTLAGMSGSKASMY